MALSSTPGLVWALIEAVKHIRMSNGEEQTNLSTGTESPACHSKVFPEGLGNPQGFRQAPVPVSAAQVCL